MEHLAIHLCFSQRGCLDSCTLGGQLRLLEQLSQTCIRPRLPRRLDIGMLGIKNRTTACRTCLVRHGPWVGHVAFAVRPSQRRSTRQPITCANGRRSLRRFRRLDFESNFLGSPQGRPHRRPERRPLRIGPGGRTNCQIRHARPSCKLSRFTLDPGKTTNTGRLPQGLVEAEGD